MREITAEEIFPIYLPPYDWGKWVENPRGYEKLFHAHREGRSWYCYGVQISTPDTIVLIAYDMKHNVWGGIGDESFRIHLSVDPAVTRDDIMRKCISVAAEQRQDELQAAEDALIHSRANALFLKFGVVNG